MRAKPGRGNHSTRKYAPPQTTNPDKSRQQWNQSNAEARAMAARERAEERQEELLEQKAER